MIDPRKVTAVIPTRGDVDMQPILDSLIFGKCLVWNNSEMASDLGAFGRYVLIDKARGSAIYTQDDDCLVSPEMQLLLCHEWEPGELLSNMEPNHNVGMPLLALPGWGAVFDPGAPEKAFEIWSQEHPEDFGSVEFLTIGCDIVFPVLTPSRMIDLGHDNMPYAWNENRTNLQPGYREKKDWYYQEAAKLRARIPA